MTKYVWHDGHWYPVGARSPRDPVFPAIIRDQMATLQHPVTGEWLDSKSQFRRRTAEAGCVELGNDAPVSVEGYKADIKDIRQDIVEAMQKVEQGYTPETPETVSADARIYK